MFSGMLVAWMGMTAPTVSVSAIPLAEALSTRARPVTVTQVAVVRQIANVRRGDRVRLQGEVVAVLDADRFRLADGTGSIPVVLPWNGGPTVTEGDNVVVEGRVHDEVTFGLSRPEILATRVDLPGGATLTFAEPAATGPATPAETVAITPIRQVRRGQSATVRGRVERILDTDEFRLTDASGSIRVYIGWTHRLDVAVGETVLVRGTRDDDPWPLPAEFYASSIQPEGRATVELLAANAAARPATTTPTPRVLTGVRPTVTTPIAQLRPYDTVRIEGVVERITDQDEFRIRDSTGTVRVYIGWRNAMPVTPGEQVSVVGIVDSRGVGGALREVYAFDITNGVGQTFDLQTPRFDEAPAMTQPEVSSRPSLPLSRVADVRRGQPVHLRGTVERIRDTDEFILRDDSGSIRIYIGWRNAMPVSTGDAVTVFGTADDDVFPGLRPEIYADRIITADGRTVTLIQGG